MGRGVKPDPGVLATRCRMLSCGRFLVLDEHLRREEFSAVNRWMEATGWVFHGVIEGAYVWRAYQPPHLLMANR